MSFLMFADLGLIDQYNFQERCFRVFLSKVSQGYRNNPYHNWRHGFSVLQFAYTMLRETHLKCELSRLQMFGLLLAAVAHDVDHTGRNNDFEMKSDSDLAIQYNYQ